MPRQMMLIQGPTTIRSKTNIPFEVVQPTQNHHIANSPQESNLHSDPECIFDSCDRAALNFRGRQSMNNNKVRRLGNNSELSPNVGF